MTLRAYTGLSPQRVNKDAKYSVTTGKVIKLEFQESQRVRILLTTEPEEHEELVDMVNAVKRQLNKTEGGQFYINEFHDVLVPSGRAGEPCYWAGNYDSVLEFKEGDLFVSPIPSDDLQPGQMWSGPHVGIPYVLNAGATDIKYEKIDGRRRETVFLSDSKDVGRVRKLTERLAKHKGLSGGRIFINEHAEFFAPVGVAGDWEYRYLGPLDTDVWFAAPKGYVRP